MNIIVGRNGSGKTALLEALFLGSGSGPALALRLRTWRKLSETEITIPTDPRQLAELWMDLFHGFDTDKPVSIRVVDSEGTARTVRIYTSDDDSLTLPLGDNPRSDYDRVAPLKFQIKHGNAEPEIYSVAITRSGLQIRGSRKVFNGAFLGPVSIGNSEETANRYSELSKLGKETEVLDALRKQFEQIESLSVELFSGSPTVYVKLRAHRRKMPISLLSSGINNYLSILLTIASLPRGFVVIDEIDNGMHYSILPMMWKQVYDFATLFDVQIFASTHSMECLQAMLPLTESHSSEFCLIRASNKNGSCALEQFDGIRLEAALEEHAEIR